MAMKMCCTLAQKRLTSTQWSRRAIGDVTAGVKLLTFVFMHNTELYNMEGYCKTKNGGL